MKQAFTFASMICLAICSVENLSHAQVVSGRLAVVSSTNARPKQAPGSFSKPDDLVIIVGERADAGSGRMSLIRRMDGRANSTEHWVPQDSIQVFRTVSEIASGNPSTLTRTAPPSPDMPALIRLQSEPIRRAWLDVETAISENQKLKPAEQLPEPFFARAELLAYVNDFDSALRDYLTAVQLASQSQQDLVAYAAYFLRLKDVLEGYEHTPRPPAIGDPLIYYGEGLRSFWGGQNDAALVHFSNAIALGAHEPIYWYYRALTHRRNGQGERAEHDALIGAHIEWRDGRRNDLGSHLERVQGAERQWLEGFRIGDPKQLILNRSYSTRS